MTEQDDETRADFIARIAERYEVPMNLIRYQETQATDIDTDG